MAGVLVFRYGKEELSVLPETMVVQDEQGDECTSGEGAGNGHPHRNRQHGVPAARVC